MTPEEWQEGLKTLANLHDSNEDFAYGLLAEGAQRLEIVAFGKGTTIEKIELIPDGNGGYLSEIEAK